MNEEITILQNQLESMATIFNAIPEDTFQLTSSDTLLILQRRMKNSDLHHELCIFNEIFSKVDGARICDIEKSATAFIRIQILVKAESDSYTPVILRQLIKEYKTQITKVTNIIHLSKVNALTADDYQKETIQCMQQKNEAFLLAFQKEIESLEKEIERHPVAKEIMQEKKLVKPEKAVKESAFDKVLLQFQRLRSDRKSKVEVENRLREEEKKQAQTSCEEIPFYDNMLTFTEVFSCKDIPAYSLIKRRNNIYFGLSKNVGKSNYDNADHSLVELTKVTEEFMQFMTEDLLSGEYELQPFTKAEKESMKMYFEFISKCFEQHIGVTLTVQEYLKFKGYYNRIVLLMFELERQQKEDYYKASVLADSYMTYMESYDLQCVEEKEVIISDFVAERNQSYLQDLDLILKNHVVDEKSKKDLEDLKRNIKEFHKPKQEEEVQVLEDKQVLVNQGSLLPYGNVGVQGLPMPLYANGVMQIVVQILNQNHEVIDEALYAGSNIKQALCDYDARNAQIKRLGFRSNGTDVFYKEEVN